MVTLVERIKARGEAVVRVAAALEGLSVEEQAAVLEIVGDMVDADRRPRATARPRLVEESAEKPKWQQAAEAIGEVGSTAPFEVVAKALGGTKSAASHALRRAEEQGAAKSEGSGLWRRVA